MAAYSSGVGVTHISGDDDIQQLDFFELGYTRYAGLTPSGISVIYRPYDSLLLGHFKRFAEAIPNAKTCQIDFKVVSSQWQQLKPKA